MKRLMLLLPLILMILLLVSCGESDFHTHVTATLPGIAPTCTREGTADTVYCTVCGEILSGGETLPPAGHTPAEEPGTPATCQSSGMTGLVYCSVCHVHLVPASVIPAGAHVPKELPGTPATCQSTGMTGGVECEVCHMSLEEPKVIPAGAHVPKELPGTPATCQSTGMTGGVECEVCHTTLEEPKFLPKTNHTPMTSPTKPATCKEEGHTGGTECSVCHTVLTAPTTTPLVDHFPVVLSAKTANCLAPGLTEGLACTFCGKILVEQEVVPISHHFELTRIKTSGSNEDPFRGEFTCSYCEKVEVITITPETLGVPMINIIGDISAAKGETKAQVSVLYLDGKQTIEADATLKVQGGTSSGFPKKNYNIRFFEPDGTYETKKKVKLVSEWGKESKYTLKANYVDFTQARNIIAAKLYGEIVHSRDKTDEISGLVNGGAIDGYPIAVYVNGRFHGLYTMNIPKDDWLFGMKKTTAHQAIVAGQDWSDGPKLRAHMTADFAGFDMQYCSTEDTSWIPTSFNRMMDFVNNTTAEEFRAGIDTYIDHERAIDTMLLLYYLSAADNLSKNLIWATYDGVKWYPSPYDLDGTFSHNWDGKREYGQSTISVAALRSATGNTCNLWDRLFECYPVEIYDRFAELETTIFSVEHIEELFTGFWDGIPDVLFTADRVKWPDMPKPNRTGDKLDLILDFYRARLPYMQKELHKLLPLEP